jgi:hypothetical protein
MCLAISALNSANRLLSALGRALLFCPALIEDFGANREVVVELEFWWRRGELNPRPKTVRPRPLHAYSAFCSRRITARGRALKRPADLSFGRSSNRRTAIP